MRDLFPAWCVALLSSLSHDCSAPWRFDYTQEARHSANNHSTTSNASAASATSAFRTTYALTVINPLTVVAFMAFVPQLGMSSGSTALVAGAGLFVGSLLIQVGIALVGTVLKHVMSSRGIRALNVLSAAGIVAFGFVDLLR